MQNISELSERLSHLGLGNSTAWLCRRICFKPRNFSLTKTLQKANDRIAFHLCFEYLESADVYELKHYDAVLYKERTIIDKVINNVNPVVLDKRMASVNWKEVFLDELAFNGSMDEKIIWNEVQVIEDIVNDLTTLEKGEGKEVALCLKLKHWEGTAYSEFAGSIISSKIKWEISQRFYSQPNGDIISTEDAYRFLQNNWLERELKARRKADRDAVSQSSDDIRTNTMPAGKSRVKRNGGRKAK